MPSQTFIFECSSSTYLDCVEKSLFGSNKPWPLQIKTGDNCLLHHYEIGGLLGLWQATCDGGKNLVPKVWGGKFPYQMRVKLVIPKVTDVLKKVLTNLGVDAAVGRFESLVAPMTGQADRNHAEAAILCKLRDTLLPKLLSGELSVADVEHTMENA